ncbi:LacI family DNA-binding transcriptional regulator [Shimia sp.]|uniref:LacI family DNA-binding transcriptional regulator n=1 Tax=Shimia sp. TaxID=1954381 RepID=UPI003BAB602B
MSRPPSHKKRANLRDVAREAGVSVATVSRVLNTPDLVQEATRSRVQRVIDDLGFVRSAAARAINSGRTQILGALVPTLDNDIFAITLNAMENRLVELGFSLVVATTDEDPEKEARKAKELLDNGVEGLVLTGKSHTKALFDMLERRDVPALVISCFDPEYSLPTIGYDNHKAAALAYQHLRSSGHENIAVVHGPTAFNDRTQARLAAIAELQGGTLRNALETELSVAGGAQAVRELLSQPNEYDAILCLSDVIAFGALNALHRAGKSVPKDISVMGIQDLPASAETYPRLTTVHLPVQQMGRQAAEGIANWVVDQRPPAPTEVQSRLIERETVGNKLGPNGKKGQRTAPS